MERVRMLAEVSSTTGEVMFIKGKEYDVIEKYKSGAVTARSERGYPEGMYTSEFELV